MQDLNTNHPNVTPVTLCRIQLHHMTVNMSIGWKRAHVAFILPHRRQPHHLLCASRVKVVCQMLWKQLISQIQRRVRHNQGNGRNNLQAFVHCHTTWRFQVYNSSKQIHWKHFGLEAHLQSVPPYEVYSIPYQIGMHYLGWNSHNADLPMPLAKSKILVRPHLVLLLFLSNDTRTRRPEERGKLQKTASHHGRAQHHQRQLENWRKKVEKFDKQHLFLYPKSRSMSNLYRRDKDQEVQHDLLDSNVSLPPPPPPLTPTLKHTRIVYKADMPTGKKVSFSNGREQWLSCKQLALFTVMYTITLYLTMIIKRQKKSHAMDCFPYFSKLSCNLVY